MNICNNKWFRLSLHNPRGEPLHFKALIQPHRKSMANVNYIGNETCPDLYHLHHHFVIHILDIYWLWFLIRLELKEERLSDFKVVRYEATHYAMIEEQLNV